MGEWNTPSRRRAHLRRMLSKYTCRFLPEGARRAVAGLCGLDKDSSSTGFLFDVDKPHRVRCVQEPWRISRYHQDSPEKYKYDSKPFVRAARAPVIFEKRPVGNKGQVGTLGVRGCQL